MADILSGPSGSVKLNKKPSVAAPKAEKPTAAKKPAVVKVRRPWPTKLTDDSMYA